MQLSLQTNLKLSIEEFLEIGENIVLSPEIVLAIEILSRIIALGKIREIDSEVILDAGIQGISTRIDPVMILEIKILETDPEKIIVLATILEIGKIIDLENEVFLEEERTEIPDNQVFLDNAMIDRTGREVFLVTEILDKVVTLETEVPTIRKPETDMVEIILTNVLRVEIDRNLEIGEIIISRSNEATIIEVVVLFEEKTEIAETLVEIKMTRVIVQTLALRIEIIDRIITPEIGRAQLRAEICILK
jgi:hypothetical protein